MPSSLFFFFFFNDTATTEIYTLSLHDALPISSTTIPRHSLVESDPVELDVPALGDLAISLFFPGTAAATTSHILALQTNYVSGETGDATAARKFPVARTIDSWPFLTGVEIGRASCRERV